MQLKTRLLLFIVGISFFGLGLIGVVTYNSTIESDFRNEVKALSEFSEHMAVMLKGKKDPDEIKKALGMFNNEHYGTYLIDSDQNIHPSDNNISTHKHTIAALIKEFLRSGEHSGFLENIDAENRNTKMRISIAWHITEIQGSPYSVALVRDCSDDDEFEAFWDVFGVQLVVSGMVILWIAMWGALILASLFKRLEKQSDELKDARDCAEQASKAKSEFLAVMSHEMRTPLTAIIGFSEVMLRHEQSKEDDDESTEIIHRTGKHLLHLINDILDLSKIEANKLEIEHINFSPLKLMSDIEMIFRPQAVEKNLGFEVHYDFPLPHEINSDEFRVKQILYNLFSNAIKFTKNGFVRLNVSCDVNAQLMNFEVVDTGIGIRKENIERVFQSFTQADASISRKYGGTGLGISLSKKLAEMLDGNITLKSEIGVGSRFLLTISTGALDNAKFVNSVNQLPRTGTHLNKENSDLTGKVLVAEDNEDNQRLFSLLLKKVGVEVILAANGEEAVEKALNNSIDIVLMDMQMPVMDGMEATRTLREKRFSKPIIALTANTMEEDRNRCFSAGCDDFLGKPIDRGSLYEVLSKYLGDAEEASVVQKPEIKTDENNNGDGAPIVSTLSDDPLSDDPDFADIIVLFIDNLREMQANIQNALKDKDWAELDNLCHQLKGSGGGIGFPLISEVSSEVEKYIKEQAYDQVQSEIERLNLVCDRIYAGAGNSRLEKEA